MLPQEGPASDSLATYAGRNQTWVRAICLALVVESLDALTLFSSDHNLFHQNVCDKHAINMVKKNL